MFLFVAGAVTVVVLLYFDLPLIYAVSSMKDTPEQSSAENVDDRFHIARPALQEKLLALLRPHDTTTYTIVVGPHGSGKSVAIRNALRCPGPDGINGVILVDFTNVQTFCIDLEQRFDPLVKWKAAFGFGYRNDTVDASCKADFALWRSVSVKLLKLSRDFRMKYNRPMTLIIDDAHLIAKKSPEFLLLLQRFAKQAADTHNLNVVFVSSDNTVKTLMASQTEWSRAVMFEVDDVTEPEAVEFAKKRHGLTWEDASLLVSTVTGGRVGLLADPSIAFKPVIAVRKSMDADTDATVKKLGMEPSHLFFQELVKSDRIDACIALNRLEGDHVLLAKLVEAKIIVAHADESYSFYSRQVAAFLTPPLAPQSTPRPSPEPKPQTSYVFTALLQVAFVVVCILSASAARRSGVSHGKLFR